MRKFIVFGAGILALFLLLAGVWGYRLVYAEGETGQETTFLVKPGESVRAIAQRLEEARVVAHPVLFEWFVRARGVGDRLQVGEFTLPTGAGFVAVLDVLLQSTQTDRQVTFPEGYTLQRMAGVLSENLPTWNEEEWQQYVGEDSHFVSEFLFLKTIPSDQGLEGYLFPDTYRFSPDAGVEEVVQTLLQTTERRWEEVGLVVAPDGLTEQEMTIHELITLASIVEREVRSPDDMRRVAGIFFNRLDVGMPLQADSTVNYVINGDSPSLTLEQTKLDTPYNTYKYPGLPPGPISNPGANAIRAVLQPEDHDWFYFLTTPEGEVKYAKTFAEHVANKQKYLR